MLNSTLRLPGRIAIFAVAHAKYWAQFPTLKGKLQEYHTELCKKLTDFGAEVTDFGIIDSERQGYELLPRLKAADCDVWFCNMITYATSSVFAPVMRDADRPVVLTALQPLNALDYTKANTLMQLENDCICSVPEYVGVANRLGKKISDVIIGTLNGDEKADKELLQWCKIAAVLRALHGARIGLMGHVLEAMYDMHSDPTAVSAAFGLHVPLLEPDSILPYEKAVTEEEIAAKSAEICEKFDRPDPVSDPITKKLTEEDLRDSARSAVALEKFVKDNKLNGLAYYYEGLEGSEVRKAISSLIVGNSLLIGKGFPMCGEFDIKTCIAMLIMDRLGIGGSFAELHPFDFNNDCILIGHDGPHHIAIAEGKPVIRSLLKYHGKEGSGASVEFKIKEGPITMLGITQDANGQFRFIIGEGESQAGPIPPTGNTNTRAVFKPSTREYIKKWVMAGPTHHYALGIGHHAETIKKIADVLGIEAVIVK